MNCCSHAYLCVAPKASEGKLEDKTCGDVTLFVLDWSEIKPGGNELTWKIFVSAWQNKFCLWIISLAGWSNCLSHAYRPNKGCLLVEGKTQDKTVGNIMLHVYQHVGTLCEKEAIVLVWEKKSCFCHTFSESYDQQVSDFSKSIFCKMCFCKVYFSRCTRLTNLLNFVSLFHVASIVDYDFIS